MRSRVHERIRGTAEHVLEELGPLMHALRSPAPSAPVRPSMLSSAEAQLLDCLDDEPAPIDALVERSGLTADNVSSILLQLELRGLVLVGTYGYQRAP